MRNKKFSFKKLKVLYNFDDGIDRKVILKGGGKDWVESAQDKCSFVNMVVNIPR
jgi:hypothetical protein